MKKFIIALIGFLAFVYLINPTAGVFEFIPDNIPGVGNLDEFTATTILLSALGYFGIDLGKDLLTLEPKLGTDPARVHLYIPAADLYVAYDYRYIPDADRIIMEYRSNFPGEGRIKVLIPEVMRDGIEKSSEALRVLLDGKEAPNESVFIHRDMFIVVDTDFQKHKLEIFRK